MKIFKVTLKTTNALRDFAESKEGKSLIVEHGEIYILEKDIDFDDIADDKEQEE